jgi:hypothetical protein
MADITATKSGETMITGVNAETEAGVEFVDAWFPTRQGATANCTVIDSGRLLFETKDLDQFLQDALAKGVSVEVVDGL